MALRMKILSDEVNNLTVKWKDSERTNKHEKNNRMVGGADVAADAGHSCVCGGRYH